MADIGDLAKLVLNLKIIPLQKIGKEPLTTMVPAGIPFVALINPESFAIKEDVKFCNGVPIGKAGSDPVYIKTNPRSFTLEFVLDGTGANGLKIPVVAQVVLFKQATSKALGIAHRSPWLILQYGTFICDCVINDSTITYTLFDTFGVPLRAKVSASFTERTESTLNAITSMFSSPDLTHIREVKPGDLLPVMVFREYHDQNYYIQVARVNRLKNFRKLKPGTTIILPPINDD